ncbi:hypothetical protein [Paenarthrobacter sp. NPDC018779]|uniref:hypothetical protein n=1 Tax=Paenarthrobacter sp. NPDC018779 TaxID=3364375 RepID=UPI0037C66B99
MPGFTIQYNKKTQERLVEVFEGDSGHRDAMKRRLELEKKHLGMDWEIVSLNATSLASIQQSHSRYFHGRDITVIA